MEEKIACTVDYLRYSAATGVPINSLLPSEVYINMNSTIEPLPNYTHAISLEIGGRIDWNSVSKTQGSLVTLSGQDLQSIYQEGLKPEYLARFVAKNKWLHASRIDLTADILNIESSPTDILNAWLAKRIKTHARGIDQIIGYDKACDRTGNTVYIGSRKSDTYLRVYSKGDEQKSDELWTRVEFELKGDRAKVATNKTAATSVGQVLASLATNYIQVSGLEWWNRMLAELPSANDILRTSRKSEKTNSQKWLEEQALPAVVKSILRGDEYTRDEILRALIEYNKKVDYFTEN
jgi:hypothetical protein